MRIIPRYNTMLFGDVFGSDIEFKNEWESSPFFKTGSTAAWKIMDAFYLIAAEYYNSPICGYDINQWKLRFFAKLKQLCPTWSQKVDIQENLQELTEAEAREGNKVIYNQADNPSGAPSTDDLKEIGYIKSQNTSNYKKSRLEALIAKYEVLDDKLNERFIRGFKDLFLRVVAPQCPTLYLGDDDDEEC